MQHSNNYDKWYAIFVVTGEEDKVKERLQYRFNDVALKALVPKRKLKERKNGMWETRIRNLFPGYVLLNGHIGVEEYYTFKGVPGIIRLLKDKHEPLQIEDEEIDVFRHLLSDDDLIGASSVYEENGRIIVIDGPLLGLDGLIESIDKRKGRAKVRLNFAGEPRLVDLSINMVQPA